MKEAGGDVLNTMYVESKGGGYITRYGGSLGGVWWVGTNLVQDLGVGEGGVGGLTTRPQLPQQDAFRGGKRLHITSLSQATFIHYT